MSSFIGTDWTLSLLHSGSYLNIDDILASNERTSCRIRVPLPSLAPLLLSDIKDKAFSGGTNDGCRASDDVPAGKRIELPVWLAIAVGSGRRQILNIDLPPIYRDAFTEVFEADPCVVDLKRKGSMYYMLLCNLLTSGHAKVPQIVATGTKVFQSRLKMIMDASLNASRQDNLSSTSK
ncbi:DNA replication complex GINS protein isoform 1 [Schistosoma japonicum]|nr:DNA replication complex GINS protein isoform 1 [Schistosoma japonicum]